MTLCVLVGVCRCECVWGLLMMLNPHSLTHSHSHTHVCCPPYTLHFFSHFFHTHPSIHTQRNQSIPRQAKVLLRDLEEVSAKAAAEARNYADKSKALQQRAAKLVSSGVGRVTSFWQCSPSHPLTLSHLTLFVSLSPCLSHSHSSPLPVPLSHTHYNS